MRSNLEFATSIWSPHNVTNRKFIESTQKQFALVLKRKEEDRQFMLDHSLTDSSKKVVDDFDIGPYHDRILSLSFSTLARRRVNSAALFIHSLIIGKLKSPYLRSLLILNTGQRTYRNPEFIKLKTYRTDHTTHSPFNNACRIFNHAALFIEPSLPHIEFRKRLFQLPDYSFGPWVKLA